MSICISLSLHYGLDTVLLSGLLKNNQLQTKLGLECMFLYSLTDEASHTCLLHQFA